MESAWQAFCLKVEHNELRRQCRMRPVYLTDEQTRRAHSSLQGELKAGEAIAREIPNDD